MKVLALRSEEFPKNSPGSRRFYSLIRSLSFTHDLSVAAVTQADSINFAKVIKLPVLNFTRNRLYIRALGVIRRKLPMLDYFCSLNVYTLEKLKRSIQSEDFDVIICSYQPISCVTLAAKLSKVTGIPFVVDLRDLPNQFLTLGQHNQESRYLKNLLSKASGITITTDKLQERLKLEYSINSSKVVYNGVESELLSHSLKFKASHDFKIIYAGSLYEGRDLTPVLDAANKLSKVVELPIFVEVYGNINSSLIKKYSKIYPDIFSFKGMVEREILLTSYSTAKALVNILPYDHRDAIPSKIFEYIASGLPIINLTEGESFVSNLIEKSGSGVNLHSSDACFDYLYSLYNRVILNDFLPVITDCSEVISEYTRENQGKNYSNYLENIIECKII